MYCVIVDLHLVGSMLLASKLCATVGEFLYAFVVF